jgi:transcriptional regulator with GAF, ATPase, and Fis domain
VTISIPPLRERTGDVRLLAAHFLDRFRRDYGQPDRHLPIELVDWMNGYHWPGNVRELENLIHRFFVLEDETVEEIRSHGAETVERRKNVFDRRIGHCFSLSYREAKARMLQDFEQRYLSWLMAETGGNVSQAARICGKERRALGRLLKKYEIDRGA